MESRGLTVEGPCHFQRIREQDVEKNKTLKNVTLLLMSENLDLPYRQSFIKEVCA